MTEAFNQKKFTSEQKQEISKLNVDANYDTFGSSGCLSWIIFSDGELTAKYSFEARDVDGDWGYAASIRRNLSFDELISIIKNPHNHFDTRSWN